MKQTTTVALAALGKKQIRDTRPYTVPESTLQQSCSDRIAGQLEPGQADVAIKAKCP